MSAPHWRRSQSCLVCGKPFRAGRAHAGTCSARCRTRLCRHRRKGGPQPSSDKQRFGQSQRLERPPPPYFQPKCEASMGSTVQVIGPFRFHPQHVLYWTEPQIAQAPPCVRAQAAGAWCELHPVKVARRMAHQGGGEQRGFFGLARGGKDFGLTFHQLFRRSRYPDGAGDGA
jgi:hypothetical protein